MYLLTTDTAKAVKAKGTGFINAIMFLEPGGARCPNATAECLKYCLRTSSRLQSDQAGKARRKRTNLLRDNPAQFYSQLYRELRLFEAYCDQHRKFAAVRLNGLSDIDFRPVYRDFPHIQFYEYTKRPSFILDAMAGLNPLNVHYTLSRTGPTLESIGGNGVLCAIYIDAGGIVAQISTRPITGIESIRTVDGDRHDLRFLDPPGSIAHLTPKGAMKAALKRGEHFAMVLE